MRIYKFRTVTAVIGAAAVIALGALAVVLPAAQATADTAVPVSHFGDPVDTDVHQPTMELGVPMSTSATASPLNAPPGVVGATG